jgi:hypothetical protein
MRKAFALSLIAGALFLVPAAASAAPLALSDHAAVTRTLGDANAGVKQVGWRRRAARRCARRYARRYCCTWTCRPYWRPYQYYYWQQYYPYGGPLFY